MNLSNYVKISQGAATTTAGTSDVNGDILDMSGYDGVLWVAKFGTAASNNTLHAQQDSASGGGTMADLAGTSVTVGSSDEIVWLDLKHNPAGERYVRVVADRGTSTTLDWCVALRYDAKTLPVDNATAGTIAGEIQTHVAEGTA